MNKLQKSINKKIFYTNYKRVNFPMYGITVVLSHQRAPMPPPTFGLYFLHMVKRTHVLSKTKIKSYWSFALVTKAFLSLLKLCLYILKLKLWHSSEMVSEIIIFFKDAYLILFHYVYTCGERMLMVVSSGCSSFVRALAAQATS